MNQAEAVSLTNDVKRIYEAMFLVDSSLAGGDWQEVSSAIETIITHRAELINIRKWDDRRLCYDIRGHKRGTYVLSYFRAEPTAITSIERDVQLSESILRVLILRADHLSKDPEQAEAQMNAQTPATQAAAAEQKAQERSAAQAAAAEQKTQERSAADSRADESTTESLSDEGQGDEIESPPVAAPPAVTAPAPVDALEPVDTKISAPDDLPEALDDKPIEPDKAADESQSDETIA